VGSISPRPQISRLAPVLLPLLVSLYVPLVIAAALPGELLRLRDFWWPVFVTLAVCTVGWMLGYWWTRVASKAALVSVLITLLWSSLGAAAETINPAFGNAATAATSVLVLLYGVLPVSLAVAIVKARSRLEGATKFLAAMAAFLLMWNMGRVTWTSAHAGRLPAPPLAANIWAPAIPTAPVRDIYLIVLDKYTSSGVLASHYGFDNSAFEAALRRRGFVIPSAAHSNYVHTFLTLASMLNLSYLDGFTKRFGPTGTWDQAYPLIENNRLAAFLHARGYRVVFFPTAFGGTRQNRYADLQLPAPRDVRPELYAAWAHLTAWPLVRALGCRMLGCDPDGPPYQPSDPTLMDWRFRALAHLAGSSGRPQFVFAHFLVPHEPYIYGPDCRHRAPYWPATDWSDARRVRQDYLDQIRCVNSMVLKAVDSIQARSRVPPVILIQADHGHGRFGRDIPPLSDASPEAIRERVSVFAAYALPTVRPTDIPDSISPVNVTRAVLRHYFRAALPPLPETVYWSATNSAYRFERVDLR
jgi:hypothetical protein